MPGDTSAPPEELMGPPTARRPLPQAVPPRWFKVTSKTGGDILADNPPREPTRIPRPRRLPLAIANKRVANDFLDRLRNADQLPESELFALYHDINRSNVAPDPRGKLLDKINDERRRRVQMRAQMETDARPEATPAPKESNWNRITPRTLGRGALNNAGKYEPGQNRQSSQLLSLPRGVVEGEAKIIRAPGVAGAETAYRLNEAYNRIDHGETVHWLEVPKPVQEMLKSYLRAGPQRRAKMRAYIEAQPIDARNTASFKYAERFEQTGKRLFPTNEKYKDELGQKIPRFIGKMAPVTIVTALGKRLLGIPMLVSGALSEVALSRGKGFTDLIKNGASLGDAYKGSRLYALTAIPEAVPIARVLGKLDKASGRAIRKALVEGLAGGAEGVFKGFSKSIMENLIKSKFVEYDPETGMFKGTGEAAGLEFANGALYGVLASMFGVRFRFRKTAAGAPAPDNR